MGAGEPPGQGGRGHLRAQGGGRPAVGPQRHEHLVGVGARGAPDIRTTPKKQEKYIRADLPGQEGRGWRREGSLVWARQCLHASTRNSQSRVRPRVALWCFSLII